VAWTKPAYEMQKRGDLRPKKRTQFRESARGVEPGFESIARVTNTPYAPRSVHRAGVGEPVRCEEPADADGDRCLQGATSHSKGHAGAAVGAEAARGVDGVWRPGAVA